MRILILGGTRFTGRELVRKLLSRGHDVTTISRRPEESPSDAVAVSGERVEGIEKLAGDAFDITVDFICYNAEGPGEVFKFIQPGLYVLISTVWLARLYPACDADCPVHQYAPRKSPNMLDITVEYLLGKVSAERETHRFRKDGAQATVLRLPLQWGLSDHTKRYDFYRQRFLDGDPVILINGGRNLAQIAWNQDIATAMAKWLNSGVAQSRPIWEALPDEGVPVRKTLADIAESQGSKPRLIDIPSTELSRMLPEYLEAEPLWREQPLAPTKNNLFRRMDLMPTPQAAWLRILAASEPAGIDASLRAAELKFVSTLIDA